MMGNLKLISDSFGYGHLGNYLANLEEEFHVVVEYFLFETPRDVAADPATHLCVAEHGMWERNLRNEEYFANLRNNVVAHPDRFSGIDPDKLGPADRFSLQYDIEQSESVKVTQDEFVREYKYAFTDPPYGIRCDSEESKLELCTQVMERLFGDLSEFIIHKWSTDWSNYFDAGDEWWGSFLWTLVANDGRGWWIGASTTD